MNMPGAEGTQARHWTDAAADGKQKDVMQVKASLSTSLIPLWRFDTKSKKGKECDHLLASVVGIMGNSWYNYEDTMDYVFWLLEYHLGIII